MKKQNAAIVQVEKELIKAKQQIAGAVTNADVAYLLHDGKTKFVKSNLLLKKATAREN
ncbi:FmtB-protein [Staphylococcus aureus]|nr:FmtB-protein [Staphylococcus aureus]